LSEAPYTNPRFTPLGESGNITYLKWCAQAGEFDQMENHGMSPLDADGVPREEEAISPEDDPNPEYSGHLMKVQVIDSCKKKGIGPLSIDVPLDRCLFRRFHAPPLDLH
jgi:hypothetical protein